MTTPGIEFDQVWKKFRRGEFQDSLRDLIPALTRQILGRKRPAENAGEDEFWALRDVSFTVDQGEALGIIGPNGAGKSTVLKVLTRILRPDRGRVQVRGRVGSLIEVAAGFHGDLTGRENVFLQGAIMGMSRREIRSRFDEIVDFAGIEEFLETPVKRYSSGMNARLGFSIAAHLDPDVLIVDEVLAVGDLRFQAKAFGRIRELVDSGIPVLIVSHQLDKIAELCTSALLLERGRVLHRGPPEDCIRRYMEPLQGERVEASESPVRICDLRFPDGTRVRSGERIRLSVEVHIGPEGVDSGVEPLAMIIRNSRTRGLVTAVAASSTGLALEGPVARVDATFQMNVPPGLYVLETVTWDRKTHTRLGRGPTAAIVVDEGQVFRGIAQLNPEMTLGSEIRSSTSETTRSGSR